MKIIYTNIKRSVYNLIRDDDENNLLSNIFDGIIITLIIINIIFVIADTFILPDKVKAVFNCIEFVSVIIFTIEYLMRVWTSDLIFPKMSITRARIKYIFSFMAIVDLLAIAPFYLPFVVNIDLRVLRALRIIRLLRIFKVNRYTNALSTIGDVFRRKKHQLLSSIIVVALLMIIAAVLMYNVENSAQPDAFSNAFSALWWAVATLTTVGYGDVYPVTVLGKILSAIIALLGIGVVAVPTGIISAGFMENIAHEQEMKKEEKHFCPYCGKNLEE
ncbi:MAG: ion transporter [Oscillospiraceae bacterium]|nr:ion transporter [Oscillospiraceae bacterium]